MFNVIDIYIVTNYDRRDLVTRCVKSIENCSSEEECDIHIIENGDNMNHASLEQYIEQRTTINFDYVDLVERHGLSQVWNLCMEDSKKEWVILCNDDVVFQNRWHFYLQKHIEMYPDRIFLLSHPNGFSCFAINKKIWKKYGKFNNEFTSGYYEDDDFYLRCAEKENIHTKKEAMSKIFFSFYDNYGKGLLNHVPYNEVQKSFKKWDKTINFKVFNRYWEEVDKNTYGAIENKNGKWYIRRK